MAEGRKRKRTETDEAENRRRRGRPRLPGEERKRRKIANDRERRKTEKFERERFEAFVTQPGIIDKYEAFKEDYNKRNGQSSKMDGTNESFDTGMLTGTPSEPQIRGREEELAEVRKGNMPITVDNCTPPVFPIGGSRSSKFMASASQTAHQSDFAGDSNWKEAQYAQKQHNTYAAKCPSSYGLDHLLLELMLETQKQLQGMVDNINPMIQKSVAAVLASFGFFPQTNAPIVSPAGPHHDPLGMQGGTNAAAGSSGGPTTQSSPHNGEVKLNQYNASCGEPEIFEMVKAFSENYRPSTEFQLKEDGDSCKEPGIADSFKAVTEKEEQEFDENDKMLVEDMMEDEIEMRSFLNSLGPECDSEFDVWDP
ncbi:hypothetical protein SLEP1_g53060 [Rubroshorea leprosula]|uniref:Uncharacterized protein n=1 Tax=Rubroshorea leprosula TaxID=152421 RepID=A0AAV5MC38_9ROSI|nr:hypothetical protein SLEP1_g53060 [Rubroshorea leprosula]